jgi:uncharacterized membrane protein
MGKSRMEAFSDGVIAILITIMVLDLKVPPGNDWSALRATMPTLAIYLMSFVFLGIYWNNHHHMLHATARINGRILWANLHLLFWLSLVPFTTTWMGDSGSAPLPTALYGVNLLCCAAAFTLLQTLIIADEGPVSTLARAVQGDVKGKISIAFYVIAIPMAFVSHWIADACFVTVALLWLAPDPRIERVVAR